MKRAGLFLLFCFFTLALAAHNGTPTSHRAHTTAAHEAPTANSALAPAEPTRASSSFEAPVMTPAETSKSTARVARGGVSIRKATEPLTREERLAERRTRKLERFEKKADRVAMNNTTSLLVGILVALVVVLAFAIDSTFGLVLLLAGAIAMLFILLR